MSAIQEKKNDGWKKFGAFASLNKYYALIEMGEVPTKEQKNQAINCFLEMYGLKSEEEAVNCENEEIVKIYNKLKGEVLL